jgi:hypothetical protein
MKRWELLDSLRALLVAAGAATVVWLMLNHG